MNKSTTLGKSKLLISPPRNQALLRYTERSTCATVKANANLIKEDSKGTAIQNSTEEKSGHNTVRPS